MTEEEILKLSGKELRIKAAELDGFTDIELMEGPIPVLMDLVEEDLFGIKDGQRQWVPDYPNDIAAAWKLIGFIQQHGCDRVAVFQCWNDENWHTHMHIPPSKQYRAEADTPHLSITYAFILAMTQETA